MPEESTKSRLLVVSLLLLLLGMLAGVIEGILHLSQYQILGRFGLFWVLTSGLLFISRWAPAMLLIAATTNAELSPPGSSYASNALRSLAPALILAALLSLFYLLLVPNLQARKSLYLEASQLFHTALNDGRQALREGRLSDAERSILTARAIHIDSPAYQDLYDQVQLALVAADHAQLEQRLQAEEASQPRQAQAATEDFYLAARTALAENRLFDAYFLARQAVALYPNRSEVRNFVAETWSRLQNAAPPSTMVTETRLYNRKLAAYKLFVDQDYLEAYRAFNQLALDQPQDPDIREYLVRSRDRLSTVYFFLDDYEQAAKRYRAQPLRFSLTDDRGSYQLRADRAIAALDAVYLENLEFMRQGVQPIHFFSPYAKLAANSLLPRAVDRDTPERTWEATWHSEHRTAHDEALAVLPFTDEAVRLVLQFSGAPRDIPLNLLITHSNQAIAYGIDAQPLRRELASRMAYPFAAVMLVLLGTALGMRFRARNRPGLGSLLLGAPVLVLMAAPLVQISKELGLSLAAYLAVFFSGGAFVTAWLLSLTILTGLCLLLSARIAMHAAQR